MKRSQLAKLTRPRLHKAVARERLFAVLDEAREHKSAICVVGPPGAGKTTLVASWLDARGIKGIWYQVDTGDSDLATFFYYLGEAARPFARKGQRPLPMLTPEYLHDIEGFSRRFFRELFSRLPHAAVLVLDNYQEVAPEQPFHQLISRAVDEVSADAVLVAVSRRDPPNCYARLIANENVHLVEWDTLKLTIEEARAITVARGGLSDNDLSQLHERSGGWAAGFTLMLEGSRKEENAAPGIAAGRDALFAYFAEQIFDNVPRATQEFLVATAYLPQIPISVARELTGKEETETILDDFYRRHLFTHRRSASEPIYWYHALFRDFLKTRAVTVLGRENCQAVIRRAAALLEAQAAFDDAFQLYAEAADWSAVTRLVEGCASDLLAKGRGQTLRDWISALPAEYLLSNHRLRFWFGTSLIPIDQVQAREQLELAFEEFRSRRDIVGQLQTTSRVITTYYFEWSYFEPLERWIGILEELISGRPDYLAPEIEFDSYSSMLLAALYRRPGHPLLLASVERVLFFLGTDIDLNRRVTGAIYLFSYALLARDIDVGARTLALVQPLLHHVELSPLNQVWIQTRMGFYFYQVGRYEEACNALTHAEAIVERYGLKGLRSADRLIDSYWCTVLVGMRSFDLARDRYKRVVAFADPTRPMDRFHLHDPVCYLLSATGDLNQLEVHSRAAIEAANAVGMPYIQAMSRVLLCEVLAESGRHEELLAVSAEARQIVRGTCHEYYEAELDLIEAFSYLARGERTMGIDRLSSGLAGASRRRDLLHVLRHNHRILEKLGMEAIQCAVELTYVAELIRCFRVSPPDPAMDSWPWLVKIRTLGTFELYVNDQLVEFVGKAPKKLLSLLKALIANGGRQVPEERLIDALWPDEEADAARKSLDITVLRLRKLLGSADMIVVSDELIGLNPQLCWTDVWAFERRTAQTEATEGEAGISAAAAAVALYRGNFLPADTEQPWTVKARERLRARFVRLVESVAQADEAAGHWEKAMAHYLKGIEADDLVEAFHLGLMRCYRALGRPAEAMTTFRRLRQTLSVVLGIAPSPAAETLARELREDSAAHHP
jgi:LuxR family maltose regulon positive regulatory protein